MTMATRPSKRPTRTNDPYGMLLDRDLSVELLDVARSVSITDGDLTTSRRRLTILLRDYVSDQEAQGKTKKCLTRVWLNPPTDAAAMIAWARGREIRPDAAAVLHFGALLATFPFVGVVARVVGQHLSTEGEIRASTAREEVCRIVGDRSSVDVSARKAYTTFDHLGLIQRDGQVIRPVAERLSVPNELSAWMAHAVLLTRRAESLPMSSIRSAPELLGIHLPGALGSLYPLTTVHGQLDGQIVEVRP